MVCDWRSDNRLISEQSDILLNNGLCQDVVCWQWPETAISLQYTVSVRFANVNWNNLGYHSNKYDLLKNTWFLIDWSHDRNFMLSKVHRRFFPIYICSTSSYLFEYYWSNYNNDCAQYMVEFSRLSQRVLGPVLLQVWDLLYLNRWSCLEVFPKKTAKPKYGNWVQTSKINTIIMNLADLTDVMCPVLLLEGHYLAEFSSSPN